MIPRNSDLPDGRQPAALVLPRKPWTNRPAYTYQRQEDHKLVYERVEGMERAQGNSREHSECFVCDLSCFCLCFCWVAMMLLIWCFLFCVSKTKCKPQSNIQRTSTTGPPCSMHMVKNKLPLPICPCCIYVHGLHKKQATRHYSQVWVIDHLNCWLARTF